MIALVETFLWWFGAMALTSASVFVGVFGANMAFVYGISCYMTELQDLQEQHQRQQRQYYEEMTRARATEMNEANETNEEEKVITTDITECLGNTETAKLLIEEALRNFDGVD